MPCYPDAQFTSDAEDGTILRVEMDDGFDWTAVGIPPWTFDTEDQSILSILTPGPANQVRYQMAMDCTGSTVTVPAHSAALVNENGRKLCAGAYLVEAG